MIRVYVRDDVEEEDSRFLGEFSPAAIMQLPSLFEKFETVIKGSDGIAHFVAAQFVCDHTGVYFEIVVDRG